MENKKGRIKIPKTYSGENCWNCECLAKGGESQEKIDEAHSECHGWYHCEAECCGGCSYCGN